MVVCACGAIELGIWIPSFPCSDPFRDSVFSQAAAPHRLRAAGSTVSLRSRQVPVPGRSGYRFTRPWTATGRL